MGVGGRRRRAGGWVSVVAVGMVFVAACSSSSNVVVQAPSATGPVTAGGSDPSQASGEPTPKVGDCRAPVDRTIIDAASDPRPTVGCREAHGTETFWVGTMTSNIQAWPGSDDRAGRLLENQVTRECGTRHLQYLGLDVGSMPNLPPDRLQSFAFFVPTERDFQDGARWFRCDAVVDPLAAENTSIDGTLKDVYAKPLPVSYRLCEARLGQPVACDQPHEIEYLASVLLDSLTQFPTQKGDIQVTAACRTPLLAALGLTEERTDLVFGYLLPTQEAWDAGSKGATCVVGAADGSTMRGTLAGIGPSAPLPEG
jgi:Septum formation